MTTFIFVILLILVIYYQLKPKKHHQKALIKNRAYKTSLTHKKTDIKQHSSNVNWHNDHQKNIDTNELIKDLLNNIKIEVNVSSSKETLEHEVIDITNEETIIPAQRNYRQVPYWYSTPQKLDSCLNV